MARVMILWDLGKILGDTIDMTKWNDCPFCGNNVVEVKEDVRQNKIFCFTSCYYCQAQGPNFYKVDLDDEQAFIYANKMWNQRNLTKLLGENLG